MIRSFLKWPGGKARVMPELQKYLPKGECLVEPFVGGATVFLNTNYRTYVLSDINPDLINLYRIATIAPEVLIKVARKLFHERNTEEAYYQTRSEFNEICGHNHLPQTTPHEEYFARRVNAAALFLYLNRHCFNGVVRYNKSKGHFNTPYGHYKGEQYFPETEINLFSEKAQDTHASFFCCSFELTICATYEHTPVIYCDPPYLPVSDTANFTEYYGGSFSVERHAQLAAELQKAAADHGCHCVISNSDTPATREIYSKFEMRAIVVNRSVSAKANTRGAAKEVIGLLPAVGQRKEVA